MLYKQRALSETLVLNVEVSHLVRRRHITHIKLLCLTVEDEARLPGHRHIVLPPEVCHVELQFRHTWQNVSVSVIRVLVEAIAETQ